ncbi:MAG: hypothetical protein ACK56J_12620 [Planctomycetota bacterium]
MTCSEGTRSVSNVVSLMIWTSRLKKDQPQRLADAGIVTRTVIRPVVSRIGFGVTTTVAPRIFIAFSKFVANWFASVTLAPGTITRRADS